MLVAIVVLAAATILIKGAGSLLPEIPDAVAARLGGLAPALLAALVITELTGADGIPRLDAKAAGVGVAVVLAAVRAPFAVCVVAGAAVAAVLRLA
ncbi:MAG TPA: AzlD domain-containing protein [Acidimicrobiales bacterium]|nr:AzlD domain-containing protein [Acidimicrobiales bacterium]